jgi:HAE1 family hydrophobic/amphiphilic exporter-1
VVSVSVTWPNASAENVERLVAEPLENAISGVSGVQTITSASSQGSASVLIQLTDGYDPNQADIDIQQAMGPVLRQLLTNATAPPRHIARPAGHMKRRQALQSGPSIYKEG